MMLMIHAFIFAVRQAAIPLFSSQCFSLLLLLLLLLLLVLASVWVKTLSCDEDAEEAKDFYFAFFACMIGALKSWKPKKQTNRRWALGGGGGRARVGGGGGHNPILGSLYLPVFGGSRILTRFSTRFSQ
jgi:hypothetical protein